MKLLKFMTGIQQVSFYTTKDGRKTLVIDGFIFEFSNRGKEYVDWCCTYNDTLNCTALARTDLNYMNVIHYNNEHNHDPDEK